MTEELDFAFRVERCLSVLRSPVRPFGCPYGTPTAMTLVYKIDSPYFFAMLLPLVKPPGTHRCQVASPNTSNWALQGPACLVPELLSSRREDSLRRLPQKRSQKFERGGKKAQGGSPRSGRFDQVAFNHTSRSVAQAKPFHAR